MARAKKFIIRYNFVDYFLEKYYEKKLDFFFFSTAYLFISHNKNMLQCYNLWPCFWTNAFLNLAHSVWSAAILWYSLCLKNLLMSSVHLTFCLRGLLLSIAKM